MARNPDHAMLARPAHDERARLAFVGALKLHVGRRLRAGNRGFYAREAAPAFEAARGRPPQGVAEIGEAMQANPHWQFWSALQRTAQEQMWDAVQAPLLREEPRLKQVYHALTGGPAAGGTLELDPAVELPGVLRETEIHLQPGGYTLDRAADDFLAGALYEMGGAVYSRAQGIGTAESKGEIIIRLLAEHYPGFAPTRILDLACAAGASATPYAEAFPQAEVHAVDVAPGLLRYAHARAEALGLPVHFHQCDVGDTGFAEGSFDLVVSHNAMHEMPAATVAAMFAECRRLLVPGGICVHQDVPLRYAQLDEYLQFEYSWDRDYNAEPFWEDYGRGDPRAQLRAAGFADEDIFVGFARQRDQSFRWFVAMARKR